MIAIDRVMGQTVSHHGFWLINHKSVILGDIMEAINKHGSSQVMQMLDDIDSKFVKDLYKKIEASKKPAFMCPIDPQEALNCESCQ